MLNKKFEIKRTKKSFKSVVVHMIIVKIVNGFKFIRRTNKVKKELMICIVIWKMSVNVTIM